MARCVRTSASVVSAAASLGCPPAAEDSRVPPDELSGRASRDHPSAVESPVPLLARHRERAGGERDLRDPREDAHRARRCDTHALSPSILSRRRVPRPSVVSPCFFPTDVAWGAGRLIPLRLIGSRSPVVSTRSEPAQSLSRPPRAQGARSTARLQRPVRDEPSVAEGRRARTQHPVMKMTLEVSNETNGRSRVGRLDRSFRLELPLPHSALGRMPRPDQSLPRELWRQLSAQCRGHGSLGRSGQSLGVRAQLPRALRRLSRFAR